ncbi:L10-interacting MYB domain-containing protein-like [Cornus florida]|uniref:L10-interacting MYB domain-containing protein-like n=1 Tax=Cornus florida TaxID=4283 RepID=UPI00289FC798|nr:L10-interacting MYB domain-containing protein-like [Cornus florida]
MDMNVENVEQCGDYLTIEEEGVTEFTKDGKLLWDNSLTEKFCNIMEEQVRVGNRTDTTFNLNGWTTMVKEMKVQTERKFNKTQLRNKFNHLRKIYVEFNKLLSETGVGYNHETGMVVVEEERWGRLSKVITGTNKFRRHGYNHVDKMSTIFGDTYATGMHAHPSTTAPPAIILPTPNDDDDEEEGCHISPPPLRKGAKAKRDSLSLSMDALLSNMDENSARRTERMEAAIKKSIKASSTFTRVSSCEKGDDEVLYPSNKE